MTPFDRAFPRQTKSKTSCLSAVASLVISVAVVPLEGAMFMLYWGWFVQYAFPSAPTISFHGGIALSMFAGLLGIDSLLGFSQVIERLPKSDTPGWARSMAHVALIGVVLVVGWLVHQYLGSPPIPLR